MKPMMTIAVSSRALFHLETEHEVWKERGQDAFDKAMLTGADMALDPGVAFPLVRRLLALNKLAREPVVEVVVLSRNSPAAGVRVMKSARHHGLTIHRAVFCSGADRFQYAKALGADLFLSANPDDAVAAIQNGVPAATIQPGRAHDKGNDELRIAFDGDAVLFDDASDAVFMQQGLEAFEANETAKRDVPLGRGPFAETVRKLAAIRDSLKKDGKAPLRLGLVTARSPAAFERAIETLRSWGVSMDEAAAANGMDKGPLVAAFGADMFFDDSIKHVESVTRLKLVAGHVPYGLRAASEAAGR